MIFKLRDEFSARNRKTNTLKVVILSTLLAGSTAFAAGPQGTSIQEINANTPPTPSAAPQLKSITPNATPDCPLNSGGPSLLGTTWRLESIYGNRVPPQVGIDMKISSNALTGFAGCNKYSANFVQVGYTGFKVRQINKTKKACPVIVPYKTAKSINVGNWEGSYLRTLRRMGSVRQMASGRLHFFNRNGETGMVLRKVGDENVAPPAPKKVIAPQAKPQQPVIKKATPVQKSQPTQNQQKPVIRKINSNSDDPVMKFIKSLGF